MCVCELSETGTIRADLLRFPHCSVSPQFAWEGRRGRIRAPVKIFSTPSSPTPQARRGCLKKNLYTKSKRLTVSCRATGASSKRVIFYSRQIVLELVRNLVAHGDAREGKWRGNWRMEWVTSTLTPPPNVFYPALLKLMSTPRLPSVDWSDAPTDLNGLVRFGERRNLVSARVPSRSARAILPINTKL